MTKSNEWEKWSKETLRDFQETFIAWYEREKRNLPWRANLDPYRIWISEIMLQQTRVDTVIDYYYRFMEWFPTVKELAEAPEDRLLKAWEGLGYYSRARNLKSAAQQIIAEHNGQMPRTIEEIRKLKGIGPYTAGAIGSIAFHLPEPAIDGNVMRVVSRLFEIDADIAKASSRKIFECAMYTIIDENRPGDFNQALMDLGSAICTPKSPKCTICPIHSYCLAYKHQTMTNFPIKSKKMKPKDIYYVASIIENSQKEFLIDQRSETGLLANMWLFPMKEVTKAHFNLLKKEGLKEHQQLSLEVENDTLVLEEPNSLVTETKSVVLQQRALGEVTHIFSHLKWHILVFYGRQIENKEIEARQLWVNASTFADYVFPKPQQKMIALWEKRANKKIV